jgi:hypothetical protein
MPAARLIVFPGRCDRIRRAYLYEVENGEKSGTQRESSLRKIQTAWQW